MLSNEQIRDRVKEDITNYRSSIAHVHLNKRAQAYQILAASYDESLRNGGVFLDLANCIEADMVGLASI